MTNYKVIMVNGYSKPALPIFPNYEKVNSDENEIDYRSTIYWNPSINIDGMALISFYASDLEGKYNISLKGLSEGEPVEGYSTITVENP
jgi:hypothetical protein